MLDSLNRRHLDVNLTCPLCRKGPETVEHVIFQCKLARSVWKLAPLPFAYAVERDHMTFEHWWTLMCFEYVAG